MDPAWNNLLTQAPLVGVFIVFTIYIVKIFLDALDKTNTAFEKRNTAVIEAIQEMNKNICGKLDRAKQITTRAKKTQG